MLLRMRIYTSLLPINTVEVTIQAYFKQHGDVKARILCSLAKKKQLAQIEFYSNRNDQNVDQVGNILFIHFKTGHKSPIQRSFFSNSIYEPLFPGIWINVDSYVIPITDARRLLLLHNSLACVGGGKTGAAPRIDRPSVVNNRMSRKQ